MRLDKAGRDRAAVLAEVLIALALLIPVIVMVAALFPYSFSVDRRAWNSRTAQSLARSALEEARGRKFDDLVTFQPSYQWPDGSTHLGQMFREGGWEKGAGTVFNVAVVVDPDPAPADTREKSVVCTVRWRGKNGDEQLRLQTIVARLYQKTED